MFSSILRVVPNISREMLNEHNACGYGMKGDVSACKWNMDLKAGDNWALCVKTLSWIFFLSKSFLVRWRRFSKARVIVMAMARKGC